MFKPNRRLFLAIAIGCLSIGTLLYAHGSIKRPKPRVIPAQNLGRPQPATNKQHVRRAMILQQLRAALNQLGNRLEQTGKERLSLVGTISSSDDNTPRPVQIIVEFPDELRMTTPRGPSVIFNANTTGNRLDELHRADRSVIQSLLYDSAERFFLSQSNGLPTRFIGSHFRNDDRSFDDLYQVIDRINLAGGEQQGAKLYGFSSATQLLHRVRYDTSIDGTLTHVETRFANWQKIGDQQLPTNITRSENGRIVVTLIITSAGFGPHMDDGAFGVS